MTMIEDKYVVLKDSTAVIENRPSASDHVKNLRKSLLKSSIMVKNDQGLYVFKEDASFDSPSYAAAAIVGGNANGQRLWKCNGKSIKEIEREEIG